MTPEQEERKRERLRQRYRRRRERMMSTPEGREILRERGRRNMAAYYERRKNNPEFVELKRARQRAYNNSGAGRATTARYLATEKGRAYLALRRASRRARRGNSCTALAHVEAMRRALLADEIYALANRLVPTGLPAFVRDDVISDLCIGVLEGDFAPEDMAGHVKAATARHRGLTSTFAVSLDDVIGDKGYTRGRAMGVY